MSLGNGAMGLSVPLNALATRLIYHFYSHRNRVIQEDNYTTMLPGALGPNQTSSKY